MHVIICEFYFIFTRFLNTSQTMRIKKELKLIESPRDAWQLKNKHIPVEIKAEYINALLNVGFDIIDVGSFVSPSIMPQLIDTEEVLKKLIPSEGKTKIMVLAGNEKRAEAALQYDCVDLLSYPFSMSEDFLFDNMRIRKKEALQTIEAMHNRCVQKNIELVVYISMAFGNPYRERWSLEELCYDVEDLIKIGIKSITLADISGDSTVRTIDEVFDQMYYEYRQIDFGLHLHWSNDWEEKIEAAYKNRCRVFDSVIFGQGECVISGQEKNNNIDTLKLLAYFQQRGEEITSINYSALSKAEKLAKAIFSI